MTLTFQGHPRSHVTLQLDSPYMFFLVMINSNIRPNYAPLRDIRLRNLSDLDFDLSRSNFKVESDDVIGLPIYSFLLMFNGKIGPN